MKKCTTIIFSIISLGLLSGCAATYKHKLGFNPSEPIRVVVLPFVQVDKAGNIIEVDSSYLIDDVAIVSSKLQETPAEYTRRLVQNELSRTGLDVVSPALVDAELSHHGFLDKNFKLDLARINGTDPAELCAHLLGCDAVLYGRLTKWDRSYFALQSVTTVGLDLKLISAKNKQVLFESQAEDSDSRGLSKGPTGFSDLVIEPLRGLDNDIITKLAENTVTKTLSPLRVQNRPEYLNTAPPAIFAAADDAPTKALNSNESLTVVLLGSPKRFATFSIGNAIQNVPMIEKDDGHYIGEFIPLPTDAFTAQPVTVALTDEYGRTTSQLVGGEKITLKSIK